MTAAILQRAAERAFLARQAKARRQVGAGAITADAAERHMRPWAAIAIRLGVDLPGLRAQMDSWVVVAGAPMTDDQRRARVADDLSEVAEWRQVLARAAGRHPGEDLLILCAHFGLTPIVAPETAGPLPGRDEIAPQATSAQPTEKALP